LPSESEQITKLEASIKKQKSVFRKTIDRANRFVEERRLNSYKAELRKLRPSHPLAS
jgi:hypothetical protein